MNPEEKKFQRISQDPNFEGRHKLATDIKMSEIYPDNIKKLKDQLEIYTERLKRQLEKTQKIDPSDKEKNSKEDIRDTIYKKQILEILFENEAVNIFELERILGENPNFSTRTFNDAWKVIQNYAENGGKNNAEKQ
jgi:23S rRNA maturation-related 3'-5' exoribonuclease YhaM